MYIVSLMKIMQEILCNFLYVNKLGIGSDDLKTQLLHKLNGHNVHGHVTVYEAITFHKAGDIL